MCHELIQGESLARLMIAKQCQTPVLALFYKLQQRLTDRSQSHRAPSCGNVLLHRRGKNRGFWWRRQLLQRRPGFVHVGQNRRVADERRHELQECQSLTMQSDISDLIEMGEGGMWVEFSSETT